MTNNEVNQTIKASNEETRLKTFCKIKFGFELDYKECFEIINSVLNLELAGITSCFSQNNSKSLVLEF